MPANHFALVIGLNDYPNFKSLNGAISDAEDFYKWVSDPKGGDVPEANRKLIKSQNDGILRPFQEEIDEALDTLLKAAKAQGGQGRFYFYFSGHGLGLNTQEVGLCMPRWSRTWRNASLLLQAYLDLLVKCGHFSHVFMFLDCCRVNEISAGGHQPNPVLTIPGALAGKTRHLVFYSTEPYTPSFEAMVSGVQSESDSTARGFFTTALMRALRGEAADKSGGVPLLSLVRHVSSLTRMLASAQQIEQNPVSKLDIGFPEVDEIRLGSYQPSFQFQELEVLGTSGPKGGETDKYTFLIEAFGRANDVKITLLDKNGKQIWEGSGSHSEELPIGDYQLLERYGGRTQYRKIRHLSSDTIVEIAQPLIASPLPFPGAETTHEYFSWPAKQWAENATDPENAGGTGSALLIFARYAERGMGPGSQLLKNVSLLDEQLKPFRDSIGAPDKSQSNDDGWHAYHVKTKPGQYYLRFDTADGPRIVPVYCFPDWQTQFFLFCKDGQPLLSTGRVYMMGLKEDFFNANRYMQLTDFAMQFLQDINLPIPEDVKREILIGKFENPILGILAVYLFAQRPELLKDEAWVLSTVMQNMNELLNAPDSPDMKMLRHLARQLKQEQTSEPDEGNFSHPPMLSFGSMRLVESLSRSGEQQVVAPQSILQKALPKLRFDAPLTNWAAETASAFLSVGDAKEKTEMEFWVESAVVQQVGDAAKWNSKIELTQIAHSLRLPLETVRQAAENLLADAAKLERLSKANFRNPNVENIKNKLTSLLDAGTTSSGKSMKICIVNAPSDRELVKEIRLNCFQQLAQKIDMVVWDESEILVGSIINQVATEKLMEADFVVPIININYFNDKLSAMLHQLALQNKKTLLPILANDYAIDLDPTFDSLQIMPLLNGQPEPIAFWQNKQLAFREIRNQLRVLLSDKS